MESTNLLIVDHQPLFLTSLKSYFSRIRDIHVTATYQRSFELLQDLKKGILIPDVVLLGICNDTDDPFNCLKELKQFSCSLSIVLLGDRAEDRIILESIRYGADSFVSKEDLADDVINAIRKVKLCGQYTSPKMAEALRNAMESNQMNQQSKKDLLNATEKEIVLLICHEYTTSQIAKTLKKSSRTIESIRKRIMAKIGAKNLAGIVKYGIQSDFYEDNIHLDMNDV
jgi:DNA-binding NarL/FixJ family response regulator